MITADLSKIIKALRVYKGLTQEKMAETLVVSKYIYQNWENDPMSIPIGYFKKMGSILGSELLSNFLSNVDTLCINKYQ